MKLSMVQVRDKVPTGAPGDSTSRLDTVAGAGPSQGWDLTFEAGMVTARKGEQCLLVPVGNVAYMRLLVVDVVVVAKPAKGKEAA